MSRPDVSHLEKQVTITERDGKTRTGTLQELIPLSHPTQCKIQIDGRQVFAPIDIVTVSDDEALP
jgi:hypothetical protein